MVSVIISARVCTSLMPNRITTANADLLISCGNVKEALAILSKVTEDKLLVFLFEGHCVKEGLILSFSCHVVFIFKQRKKWLTFT